MTPSATQHFTADDLDAFHSGALARDVQLHLETCNACRELVASDRFVLDGLSRLPGYQPRAGFEHRVMAQVTVLDASPVPVLSFPRLTPRRLAALSALAAGVVLSVAWSAMNRSVLDGWLASAQTGLFESSRTAIDVLLRSVTRQSWFEPIRQIGLSPMRLALAGAALVGLYGSGLMALRRLMTPSGGPVSNAGI